MVKCLMSNELFQPRLRDGPPPCSPDRKISVSADPDRLRLPRPVW
jgi:hypothetical protein